MNPCEEMILSLTADLPEVCTINDLIKAGIVQHRATMEVWRRKKMSPPYLRISTRKIYYPKKGIVKWMKERSYDGSKTAKISPKVEALPL